MNDELIHEGRSVVDGAPVGSGRYPRGSGKDPYQRSKDFRSYDKSLKDMGMTDKEIADHMKISLRELRAKRSVAKSDAQKGDMRRALELREKGYSTGKIGEMLDISEATVRNYLDPEKQGRVDKTRMAAENLKAAVEKHKYVDVSSGTEIALGVSETRLGYALDQLQQEGYAVNKIRVPQLGTKHETDVKVLTKDDVTYGELMKHRYDVAMYGAEKVIDADGSTKYGHVQPTSISKDRVYIKYAEDGGIDRDGLIELRRGVEDLNLGNARYAQVRIAVNDSHYLKGMAVYSDDIPDGYDIVFNTNKKRGTPMLGPKDNSVLKPLKKEDPNNPFGAAIKEEDKLTKVQRYYTDKDGKRKLSALNIVNEEGDWDNWSRNLPSQFLSKQPVPLAKRQLDLAYAKQKAEFDDICSLTNPAVKKKLLAEFADDCDTKAVDLKAASFPRQAQKVILPFNGVKETEVYAPGYENGTRVVLVRYPHGGKFEIPELVVNNKDKQAKKTIGNAQDAIGINHKTATILSGADFDGDSVALIPLSDRVKVSTSKPLKGLKDFDPGIYEIPPNSNVKVISKKSQQKKMGEVSNLITDMTIKGASNDEIERAVKHSMVVIDAVKHRYDVKASYEENRIDELKKIYQQGGASTIISRSKSPVYVDMRMQRKGINNLNTDPETGQKIHRTVKDKQLYYTDKNGKTIKRQDKSSKMYETEDAFTLTSGGSKEHPGYRIEEVYADYANKQKALGNQARKEYFNTKSMAYNPEAKKKYKAEVDSLDAKLNVALKNAPKERQAQRLGNKMVQAAVRSNPDIQDDKDQMKKLKSNSLIAARNQVGAGKKRIDFTDREWEAIQNGAISESKLTRLLANADSDKVKQRALPRANKATLSPSKEALAKSMDKSGYTTAEIAERLGVSSSLVSDAINN